MKKKGILLLAVLCLLLSACGGGRDLSANSASASSAPMAPDAKYYGGWDEVSTDDAPRVEMEEAGSPVGSGLPANTKMIYTADMSLETKDFDGASKALEEIVEELGGYFESRSVNQGGYSRSLSCTVRVPAEQFNTFLNRAGEAAHVTNKSEYKQDVSEAYYDSESRLATQRTKLERLQTLLAQAAGMEDIIALESAISETELQIEQLTGSLRKYDSLIGYSTVSVYLQEVYRLSTDEEIPVTFGQRLSTAFAAGFQRGVDGLEDFIIGVARNWMGLLIFAAVAAAVIAIFLRWRRVRHERKSPPPRPNTEAPQSEDKKEP